jgi:hypothetical protein
VSWLCWSFVAPKRLADAKPSRSVCKILQQWRRLSTRLVFAAMQSLSGLSRRDQVSQLQKSRLSEGGKGAATLTACKVREDLHIFATA